jgi:hypothetical protein
MASETLTQGVLSRVSWGASSSAMSLGSAASGMTARRDVAVGRAQAREDAAKAAATGAGAAAVGRCSGSAARSSARQWAARC